MDRSRASAYQPLSASAVIALVLGAGAIITLFGAAVGYRQNWWHFSIGLQIAEWAAYAAATGLFFSIYGAFLTRPGRQPRMRGFRMSVIGLAMALPILAVAIQWEVAARNTPPINDITTDTDDPPMFWDMPDPMDYPGAATAALQRSAYPDLAPLETMLDPDTVFELALALANENGWTIVVADLDERRLEATDASRLFGFNDEVVIRVTTADSGAARVDMRSRSRLGRIDRGVNAKRIRDFLSTLEQRVSLRLP